MDAGTNLEEADKLGTAVVERLESDVPLSGILSGARRFFSLVGNAPLSAWLQLEATGLEIDQRKAEERSPDERVGALLFGALRRAEQFSDFDVDAVLRDARKPASGEFPKRGALMYQSIFELEQMEMPAPLDARSQLDQDVVKAWGALRLQHVEARRILNLERQTLHRLVLERVERVRDERALIGIFGADAIVVFRAGGSLLAELRAAATASRRGASASSLGQQARTSLMTLGRALYSGPGGTHMSPITGKTFEIRQEMNKLHAVLDELWTRARAERKPLLERAHAAAERAYELGSKAKNETAITHAEATDALKNTYQVAHAICFSGGFPPAT